MGDAASDFVPGGRLLRAQQFAGIVQHNDEAGSSAGLRGQRGNGDG